MTSIHRWATSLAVLAALALTAGCSGDARDKEKKADKDKVARDGKDKEKGKEEHAHEGPHKGAIAEWGEEEYHPEFTVDHKKKEARVYILGPDVKKPAPIKADKVLLTIKKPAFQVELKPEKQKDDPEGTASVFVGTHDNFAREQEFEGSLSAEFGGKQYAGDFKEKAHDHDKEKGKK
jgi:hypothetical protein